MLRERKTKKLHFLVDQKQRRGEKVKEEISTYWGIGKSFWLIHDLTNFMLTRTICLWPVKHALYIWFNHLEKNALKKKTKQNGVTVVQASKMEPGSHCGCGFRHVPASLRLEFSELCQTQGHHLPSSKQYQLRAANCKLMVSRSALVTMQPFQTSINPYLKTRLPLASSSYNSW